MWYFRTFSKMVPMNKYPDSEDYYKTLSYTMSSATQAYDSGQLSFQQMVEDSPFSHAFLVGDPQTVAPKLRRLIDDYQVSDVLCWTRLGGLSHHKVMRSMDLLVNQVLPAARIQAAE
jgi:alkanesulfonate monooxygenase SsuD/methylene tetrahydromethanopterin reductase-like flavin-dependent oxidoreductase (luciferase family)